MSEELESALRESIEEGAERLHRTWPSLLATGFVGGVDVSVGVLAALFVKEETGSVILAGLAFSIGFIALTMANSELFTENFLVPIAAVIAEEAHPSAIARLWFGTLVTNLAGGVVMVVLFMTAFPELAAAAAETAKVYVERGVGIDSFLSGIVAGIVITLMTWMQHSTKQIGSKIVAAIAAAFLLSVGHLGHVIVASLDVIAAIITGAEFGWGTWFGLFLLWAVGNAVGGIGLVTVLRLIQVGGAQLQEERANDATGPEPERGRPKDEPGRKDQLEGERDQANEKRDRSRRDRSPKSS